MGFDELIFVKTMVSFTSWHTVNTQLMLVTLLFISFWVFVVACVFSLVEVCGFLIVVASFVAKHGL